MMAGDPELTPEHMMAHNLIRFNFRRILPTYSPLQVAVFLRGLGVIYCVAFASWVGQVVGLYGRDGILPVAPLLQELAQLLPGECYWRFPTLFWLDASDMSLVGLCYAGVVGGLLQACGIATRIVTCINYLLYLSLVNIGQDFTAFQWDSLLLESGFLAIFLPYGSRWIILAYRLLIGRFMLMGGIVKIASGDATWQNWTALNYHYETQPLPSPLAYYVHHLPESVHWFCTGAVLFIELIVPFFILLPRPWRLFAALSFLVLQAAILLTGSYAFFNVLTIWLCLFLFDERDIARCLPARWHIPPVSPQRPLAETLAAAWFFLTVMVLTLQAWIDWRHHYPFEFARPLLQTVAAFNWVNRYGPFAVMSTERYEVIIEGSRDGVSWQEYGFHYKPDAVVKPLRWNWPHQPRLDWQMWFVALPRVGRQHAWFEAFLQKLRDGSPTVTQLLADNPFTDAPPRVIRALLYRYRFATLDERRRSGHIWQRTLVGEL